MHVVLSTAPAESAESLASTLVEQRLAACVNVVPNVTSFFHWEGAIERSAEALLVIKTSDAKLPELMAELPDAHAYTVPEIVALEVGAVHAPYAAWVDEETGCVKGD